MGKELAVSICTILHSISGVGKLSSERHWSLSNAMSCPRSRQLSLVTFKGDYAILVLRNYKMLAEKSFFLLYNCHSFNPIENCKTLKTV